jgi:hypothetical protein
MLEQDRRETPPTSKRDAKLCYGAATEFFEFIVLVILQFRETGHVVFRDDERMAGNEGAYIRHQDKGPVLQQNLVRPGWVEA